MNSLLRRNRRDAPASINAIQLTLNLSIWTQLLFQLIFFNVFTRTIKVKQTRNKINLLNLYTPLTHKHQQSSSAMSWKSEWKLCWARARESWMLVIVICLHTFNLIDHALPPMIVDREWWINATQNWVRTFWFSFHSWFSLTVGWRRAVIDGLERKMLLKHFACCKGHDHQLEFKLRCLCAWFEFKSHFI